VEREGALETRLTRKKERGEKMGNDSSFCPSILFSLLFPLSSLLYISSLPFNTKIATE